MPEPAIYLNQAGAARVLFITPRTLQRWRVDGTGPAFVRLGRRVAYRQSDIDAWASERVYTTRAEEKAAGLRAMSPQ